MKPIADFEHYLIGEDGTVVNSRKGNVLTPSLNENGYLYVSLWHRNQQNPRTVHRLVATAYVPNPDNKPVVNHKDANRANPHKDNLEWVTQSENIRHAYQLGTMTAKRRLTQAQLHECLVRFLAGESMTALADEFDHGLSRVSINLRNLAVRSGQVSAFTAELVRQKALRNAEANQHKKQQIHQINSDGHIVATHESLTAAAHALGKTTSGPISNALVGRQKHAFGFTWKSA